MKGIKITDIFEFSVKIKRDYYLFPDSVSIPGEKAQRSILHAFTFNWNGGILNNIFFQ